MYFPFLELQKWHKRSAEIRRRNCAVLPYVFPDPPGKLVCQKAFPFGEREPRSGGRGSAAA